MDLGYKMQIMYLQRGFGDNQIPGPLAPLVPATNISGSQQYRMAGQSDLTYIPTPSGTPTPLRICSNRASPPLLYSRSPLSKELNLVQNPVLNCNQRLTAIIAWRLVSSDRCKP